MTPEDRIMQVLNGLKPGQALTQTHLSALSGVSEDAMYSAMQQLEFLGLMRSKWINRTKVFQRT